MSDLYHLTLTTGHVYCSPRAEVQPDTIERLRPLLRDGSATIAGITIELDPPQPGGRVFWLGGANRDAVRAVVCWDADNPRWWADAVAHPTEVARPLVQPPWAPWLAVELLPAATKLSPEVLAMLADAERCVAWALIEESRHA